MSNESASADQPQPSTNPLGRREANKADKLRRIRQASRETFLEKGYEDATLREIARAADVAFGTLFLYAKNKQDLLMLLFDEEQHELLQWAIKQARPDMPIEDQLIAFFAEYFNFFSKTPALSRHMLNEVTFSGGIISARLKESLKETQHQLAKLISKAQMKDEIRSGVAPGLAAHVIFNLYRAEIRYCVDDDEPDVDRSLAKLRQQFGVVFIGLAPQEPQVGDDG